MLPTVFKRFSTSHKWEYHGNSMGYGAGDDQENDSGLPRNDACGK